MSNPRHHSHAGYLRYLTPGENPTPEIPNESKEDRLKRILKAMPPGAFAKPAFILAGLKRAEERRRI